MNKHAIEMKSNIRKNTAWTVFLETITKIADTIAIIEKSKKIMHEQSLKLPIRFIQFYVFC